MLACSTEHTICHASNGNQMLEIMGKREFTLALVDIKMPGPSGLEAIARARAISPQTRYYIMSGFDEFEYAKQAVKLKVEDYLMKPLDLRTIREVLTAADQYAGDERRRRADVFRNWLESALNGRDSSLGEFEGYYCGLVAITIDDPACATGDVASLFVPYLGQIVSVSDTDRILVLCYDKKADVIEHIYKMLASEPLPRGATGFTTTITSELAQCRQLLATMLRSLGLRALLDMGSWYPVAQLHGFSVLQAEFCSCCQLWRQAYFAKDFTVFSTQSQRLTSLLRQHRELQQHGRQACDFLAATLGEREPLPTDCDQLQLRLNQVARELVVAPVQDGKAQQIIRFIQEHYHQNVSAAELSERFGLSANHIGNLVKSTLGMRYNDYVTQLRLSHAKELLLSTRLSVKEVTAACGYFSQSHFIKLFVEHEGCTPSEYRKAQA